MSKYNWKSGHIIHHSKWPKKILGNEGKVSQHCLYLSLSATCIHSGCCSKHRFCLVCLLLFYSIIILVSREILNTFEYENLLNPDDHERLATSTPNITAGCGLLYLWPHPPYDVMWYYGATLHHSCTKWWKMFSPLIGSTSQIMKC